MAILFFVLAVLFINLYPYKSKYNSNVTEVVGIVTKYNIDGDKITVYLKGKEMIVVNYYFSDEKEMLYYQSGLNLGDKIKFVGILKEPATNTVPNIFNYKKYLYYNKIYYLMQASQIIKVSNNTNMFYYIKNKIIDRIDEIDKTGYLKVFILGDKQDIDNNNLNNYQENGVSHLFSISGMHISLLVSLILFVLKKVSYNNKINYLVVILFLIFYLFLTGISPSILRTVIMFILMAINKCYNLKIKMVDIMLLVLILVIILNPLYICNIGFQFSYLISFTLILFSNKLKSIKSNFLRSLYISFVCFLVSFPIVIFNFYQVNIFSIFLNIVLIPFVSVIVYPCSLLVFIFPFISKILVLLIGILENINRVVAGIEIFKIVFSKPNIIVILIYYFVIYLGLYNKKYLFIFLFMVIVHKLLIYIDNSLKVIILDVGQGDAIFVKLPYNQGNMLIDTGGVVSYQEEKWRLKDSNYSIASGKIIPYLKASGINKLDYLVLTHGDYDHMGEAISLVNSFKVDKVIFNCGEYNNLEKELIKVLNKKKIKYYSCIKELSIDKYKLHFLNTGEYDNENDNSNVIYFNNNNYRFLFMGDAGIEKEEDILDKYNLKDIDFLKVGHHGSDTSSSEEFIDSVNPKYSLISVGKNNRYGHPKNSVLDILSNSKIYRTDQNGSIEIKLNNNGYKIRTCSS